MRDWRVQTVINMVRLISRKEISIRDMGRYLFFFFRPGKGRIGSGNKLYSVEDLSSIRGQSFKMGKFNPLWFPRLIEPTTKGIRGWEYGVLLSKMKMKGAKVLDVGTGSSLLPEYLSFLGAKVTASDLGFPLERVQENKGVKFVEADMTKLPFKDRSFGVVTCVSAIEHLDADYDDMKQVNHREFIRRTRKAIREMARVCKSGGVVYITTDFYLPKQKSDRWKTEMKYKGRIGGAYKAEEVEVFLEEFRKAGLEIKRPNYDFEQLKKSDRYSNYRGRFFTTAAFIGYRK